MHTRDAWQLLLLIPRKLHVPGLWCNKCYTSLVTIAYCALGMHNINFTDLTQAQVSLGFSAFMPYIPRAHDITITYTV